MKQIIIIGSNHHNTLSMVRCIGKQYNELILILVGEEGYVAKSKYIRQCIVIKDDFELRSLIERRRELFSNSIIISCSDTSVQVLDNCRKILPINAVYFSCSTPGRITEMMDKTEQVKLAKKLGFRVPQTIEVISGSTWDSELIQYPCIVKPNQSYIGGKHIEICHNLEDLHQAISLFPKGISLQIQKYIIKKFEIVIPGFSSGNIIKTPAYILKHRDCSGATTFSSVKIIGDRELQLIEKIQSLIHTIEYDGLFGFEFIYDGNDYYFIELNLRNDATCFSIAKAGYNIPGKYIFSKTNDYDNIDYKIKEIKSIVEFNDFSFVLQKKLGLWRWIKDLRSAECKYYYDTEDIKPFLFWMYNKFIKRIRG